MEYNIVTGSVIHMVLRLRDGGGSSNPSTSGIKGKAVNYNKSKEGNKECNKYSTSYTLIKLMKVAGYW